MSKIFQDGFDTSKSESGTLFHRMCSHVHKTRMRRLTYLGGHSALIVYTSYAKCASITLGLVRVTSDVSFLDRVCFPDMCIHPLLSIQNKANDRYRCHVTTETSHNNE